MQNPEQEAAVFTRSIAIKNPNADELLRIIRNQAGRPDRQIVCLLRGPNKRILRTTIDSANGDAIIERLKCLDSKLQKQGKIIVRSLAVPPKGILREARELIEDKGNPAFVWLDENKTA